MTSHKLDTRSSDELDTLIRQTLRREVGRNRPSPHPWTWRRIRARIERRKRLGMGGDFGGALRRVFQMGVFCINHLTACWHLQDACVEWRVDPRRSDFLIDQYGFFLLLRKPDIIQ